MNECRVKDECCIKEKCIRSKDHFRILGVVFVSIIVIGVLFAVSRYIDVAFMKYIYTSPYNANKNNVLDNFNVYKDFVTVVTALFTLVVTAFSIGGYISFKEVRKKSEEIISDYETIKKNSECEYDKIQRDLNKEYKRLKAFCNIAEAKVMADENRGSMAVIRLLQEAEKLDNNLTLTNILIGDEYFKGGIENYIAAKREYEKALGKDDKSASSYFKLAQSEFKIAVKGTKMPSDFQKYDKNFFDEQFVRIDFASPQFLTSDISGIECAIKNMSMAHACGYAEDECLFELGRMFESISKNDAAIDHYKKAFAHNECNYQIGLAYCAIWLRVNHGKVCDNMVQDGVIRILNEVGSKDLLCNKLAYALLWYIYKLKKEDKKAEEVFNLTDVNALSEMFVIAPAKN